MTRILITDIKGLVQVREDPPDRVSGSEMSILPVLENSFLLLNDGIIEDFGEMKDVPDITAGRIDASGRFVLPGFVDSHTHIVFAGSREEEFVMKIQGKTYQEIAQQGGGILNSAKKLQNTTEDELFEQAMVRIREVASTGTAAIEIKSGYGLTVEDEKKMLRVARRIGRESPLEVKTTFLGAHAIPSEYEDRSDYINLVLNEMIPAVAEENLADYCDVFCEKGFFSEDESEKIVRKGNDHGMVPKIHANQLSLSGGVQVGVRTNAISVDHLECIGDEEINILKDSSTIPTLLPGSAFFLGEPFPPARKMIGEGLPVAIASDYNPGSAPSGNMVLMTALACIKMKMTPEEAFNAATINGAYAMGLSSNYGSITRGKSASVYITKQIPSLAFIPYSFGSNPVETVILKGELFS